MSSVLMKSDHSSSGNGSEPEMFIKEGQRIKKRYEQKIRNGTEQRSREIRKAGKKNILQNLRKMKPIIFG